jgi:uncharacterized protein YjbI with pentapeptide repeats
MNLKITLEKLSAFFTKKPARFFLLAAFVWMLLMHYLNNCFQIKWEDIIVEANGMTFDLLVFGILLSVYEAVREKKDKVERLREEIDDYRGWNEKEAMYKIVGAIKRLNQLGVTDINLSNCYLENANLAGVNLANAKFISANLKEANFEDAILKGVDFRKANMQGAKFLKANLQKASFRESDLPRADFQESDLQGATFNQANLSFANLYDSNLHYTIFSGAELIGANLQQADLFRTELRGANMQNAVLKGASFGGKSLEGIYAPFSYNIMGEKYYHTNLQGADLDYLFVSEDWFDSLNKWSVFGREEIIEKYIITTDCRLCLK